VTTWIDSRDTFDGMPGSIVRHFEDDARVSDAGGARRNKITRWNSKEGRPGTRNPPRIWIS
jgi:hypothetical protein